VCIWRSKRNLRLHMCCVMLPLVLQPSNTCSICIVDSHLWVAEHSAGGSACRIPLHFHSVPTCQPLVHDVVLALVRTAAMQLPAFPRRQSLPLVQGGCSSSSSTLQGSCSSTTGSTAIPAGSTVASGCSSTSSSSTNQFLQGA
jgi:hypothetical protein